MGKAIANATNAAQGWREPASSVVMGAPQIEQPQVENQNMHGMKSKGCCFPTGNKFRSGNDDGSKQTRQAAGGMSMKHRSKHAKGQK